MNHRRRQRSRGHHEAERQSSGSHAKVLVDPLVPQGEPEMLRDAAAIAGFVDHVREHHVLAFDTEFIGEETFRPRICLVQLATSERVALIDPFEVEDLSEVWELVASPRIVTLVHAGEQDIQAVRLALGRQPERLLDTQVAAALVGLPWPCSLGSMVEQFTGHRPAKAHTFTNWDARPLSPSQLRYAADDVRYLPLAWSRLERMLSERGRLDWAMRESKEVLQGDLVFDPARQAKRAARGEPLRPSALTMLREIILIRHELARAADLPPRALLPDAVALELVKRKPANRAQLGLIRGLARPLVQDHGDAILAAIERAKSLPPSRNDRAKLLEEATVRAEIDALFLAAQARCLALELAPTLVMSRSAFAEWFAGRIEARRANGQGHPESLFDSGDWRHEALGTWLEEFVQGRTTLSLTWRDRLVDGER